MCRGGSGQGLLDGIFPTEGGVMMTLCKALHSVLLIFLKKKKKKRNL